MSLVVMADMYPSEVSLLN
jgi:hypothetical protein